MTLDELIEEAREGCVTPNRIEVVDHMAEIIKNELSVAEIVDLFLEIYDGKINI